MCISIKGQYSALKTRLQRSNFLKSVLTLSAGVVVSQAVALLTTPIISRIYGPDVLGDFSIITSSATIFGVVVCLGLIPAIMVPRENDEAKGICRLLAKGILLLSFLLFVLLVLLSGHTRLFNVSINYQAACAALCTYLVFNNLSSVCYSYVNRQKLYKVLFWNPSIGTISNAVICISLGLLGCGLWGYLTGTIASSLFLIVHMLKHANPFAGKISEDYGSIRLLKKHKDFALVLLPSELIGTLARQVPVQMLSRFWGSMVLGSYTMCLVILDLPSKFLSSPVNRVFYKEAMDRYHRGENIGDFSFRLIKANIKLAIIPIFILVIFGEPIFSFILGTKWAMAGSFASLLGIYKIMSFCNACLNGKYIVINRKKIILYIYIIMLLSYMTVFYLCHLLDFTPLQTIFAFSVVGTFMTLFDNFLFMILTKVSVIKYISFIMLYIFAPIILGTILRFLIFGR